ncbi:unnamed protein product [Rhizophagus irregularis]|nr:unnamed protein product [Rhizophagus irregularis]
MEISKEESEGRSKNLWKYVDYYHEHVTIINPITKSEEIKMSYMEGLEEGNPYVEDTHSVTEHEKNKVTYKKGLQEGLFVEYSHPIIKFEENRVIYMEDLEKRKEVYGICGECNEPGTGEKWCQTCGFGEIYSADFPEGFINCWDIDNQKWDNITNKKWVLKSLGNNNLTSEFLNEVGSHLQIFIQNVIINKVEDDKDDENGEDDKDDDYGDDEDDNKDREDIYLENIEDTYETIDYDESDCVAFFSEIYNQIKECEKIRENKLKDKNELKNIKATTYSQETYSSSLIPENSQYRLISDHYSDCEID